MKKGICYIYGAGTYYSDAVIIPSDGDMVIAADGGYSILKSKGIKPDLLLGDFDSLKDSLPEGINTLSFPVDKDYTDMYLACDEGIANGYETFIIYGGLGGRIDHSLANIMLLSYLADKGHKGFLFGDSYVTTIIKNDSFYSVDVPFINHKPDGYISVLSHSDISSGVSIHNLKYQLDNAKLTNSMVLGTSNVYLNKPYKIGVKCGSLIIAIETA